MASYRVALAAAASSASASASPRATLYEERPRLAFDDFDEDDDEEFSVTDLAEDDAELDHDGSLLACSFLEEESGGGSSSMAVATSSSQAALAQRFAAEICRTGNFHDIQDAVGTSTVEMLLSKEMSGDFVSSLLGGIIGIICDPISEILIKGVIGTIMQLIAPFFVQALLIAACAIIPGPVSDQIGNILSSMVAGVTPNIVCMMLAGVITARVMTSVSKHLRTVVCVYLENEVTPQMAGGVSHMLIHTLTSSISQGLSKELTHTLTHTLTHSLTHSVIHYYYCTYCYYYGDYCQYCFYYRDYSWLHRMSWTGSALKPNMLGDAPNNEPVNLNLLINYANKHGAPAVTHVQLDKRDTMSPGAEGHAKGGPAPQDRPDQAVYSLTKTAAEAGAQSNALAVVTQAYTTNELACQGLRHLFGVSGHHVAEASPSWTEARLALRDLNARLRIFALRFGSWSWKQSWKTFNWADLCKSEGEEPCVEHATSRLYGAWTAMMQRSCGQQGPTNANAYCCVRRLTDDDHSFCAEGAQGAGSSGMACDEDEEKAADVLRLSRRKGFDPQRHVPATYTENMLAVFGRDSRKEMDAAITELLEAQVKVHQLISTALPPPSHSLPERSLVARYADQLQTVAADLRGLNAALAVDVSRAAEFAHAYERSLYGAAALLETGAAWGPDAQDFLRRAHDADDPLQMHRLRKLFGSCAGGRAGGANCTSTESGEVEWEEEDGGEAEEAVRAL